MNLRIQYSLNIWPRRQFKKYKHRSLNLERNLIKPLFTLKNEFYIIASRQSINTLYIQPILFFESILNYRLFGIKLLMIKLNIGVKMVLYLGTPYIYKML